MLFYCVSCVKVAGIVCVSVCVCVGERDLLIHVLWCMWYCETLLCFYLYSSVWYERRW